MHLPLEKHIKYNAIADIQTRVARAGDELERTENLWRHTINAIEWWITLTFVIIVVVVNSSSQNTHAHHIHGDDIVCIHRSCVQCRM